ncbi:MAG: MoaD/ThiS family protein [Desulfobacteraceae bacterium]
MKMIEIDLKLFVTLAKYLPEESEPFRVAPGTTVEMVMENLNIPKNLVKLIFINGKREKPGYVLQQNDRLGLFPPVGGG